MIKSATFSDYRQYRYSLWRKWSEGNRYAMFIGLNPSTADETNDDPTIRRCIEFAKSWGYDGLCMTNLFAYRATNPKDMMKQADPVGKDNDQTLIDVSKYAGIVIAAWGANGSHRYRDRAVMDMIPNLHCLRVTKHGHPGHPLYLPKELKPVVFAK